MNTMTETEQVEDRYVPTMDEIREDYSFEWGGLLAEDAYPDPKRAERFNRRLAAHDAEVRKHAGENALWNQANNVGTAIAHGQLDGTDPVAVAKAIRATTPAEFAAACS